MSEAYLHSIQAAAALFSSGPHVVREYTYAIHRCENHQACAALSYRPLQENLYQVYVHGYLPSSVDPAWTLHQSKKAFTFHMASTQGVKYGPPLQSLTVDQAEKQCRAGCVGFTISPSMNEADKNYAREVDMRTNAHVFAEYARNDSAVFSIQFFRSIESVRTTEDSVYITALRNTPEQLDIQKDGLILSKLLDPTGFCCHPFDQQDIPTRQVGYIGTSTVYDFTRRVPETL